MECFIYFWCNILSMYKQSCYIKYLANSRMQLMFYFLSFSFKKLIFLIYSLNLVIYLCLSSQPINKRHIREESIFIFWITKFSKQFLNIFLWDFISKIGKDVFQLSEHHGSIAVFVIKLQQLNIVMVSS